MNMSENTAIGNDLAVIVLNWNGWKDTLECLTSLINNHSENYQIIVVDNGSTDDSLNKIRMWARGEISLSVGPFDTKQKQVSVNLIEYDQAEISEVKQRSNYLPSNGKPDIILIKNKGNLGFAGGNNVGIKYAFKNGCDKIFLLNNDTTVDPNCLRILTEFLDHSEEYDVITPKINYYDRPDLIWNCGGKLTVFGSRRYYCKNKKDNVCGNGIKNITFITGCALMVRVDIFKQYGLLSERFFLGEEDYEFSLRMKKNKIKMAVVEQAKVYHKIASSKEMIFGDNVLPSAFIFYLNRFINLRDYYTRSFWKIWRLSSLIYIVPMLRIRHGISFMKIARFIDLLFSYSNNRDSISRNDFFNAKSLFSDI